MSKYVQREIVSTIFEDDGFLERVHEHVKISLKRCPCCGTPARVLTMNDNEEGIDYLLGECPNCGLHTRKCETHEEVAELWNARKVGLAPKGKVLSCPFCGGKAEAGFCEDFPEVVIVECQKCGASSAGFANAKSAIKTWNRRV